MDDEKLIGQRSCTAEGTIILGRSACQYIFPTEISLVTEIMVASTASHQRRGRRLMVELGSPPRNAKSGSPYHYDRKRRSVHSSSGMCTGTRNHFLTLLCGILIGYLLLKPTFNKPERKSFEVGFQGTIETKRPLEEKYAVPPAGDDEYDMATDDHKDESGRASWSFNPKKEKDDDDSLGSIPREDPTSGQVEKRLIDYRDAKARSSLPTRTAPERMETKYLPDHRRMKILVTGGAGFVGSHLVDKLMMEGHEVTVLDNFFTGQKRNIEHWLHHPHFSLRVHDVTDPIELEIDQIYHLACPASPPHYQYNPVKTIKTSTLGTLRMLGLAKRTRARILLASTSEIYGDPNVHPQPETYWGNVNTIGPRACYDEGKRVAETMMYSYRNQRSSVEVRVARIFNTFGPRMHPNDGRVVSNFIIQALQNKVITIYGNGEQTRSFQYVSDLVDGLHRLMNSDYDLPVNLGNPDEYSVGDFAKYIKNMTSSKGDIVNLPKAEDDPQQRKPNITVAKTHLAWEPQVRVEDGLKRTISYFQRVLEDAGEIIPTGPGASKPQA